MAIARIGPRPDESPHAVSNCISAERLMRAVADGQTVLPTEAGRWHQIVEFRFADAVTRGEIANYDPGEAVTLDYTWWRPNPVLMLNTSTIHLGANIRRAMRRNHWETTVDCAFDDVIAECASSRRPQWITPAYTEVLHQLFEQGWAHSVEAWEGANLIAGGFGLGIGHVVTMDSIFSHRDEASKACIADLALRAAEVGVEYLNLQWPTALGVRVGAEEVAHEMLVNALRRASGPVVIPADRRLISRVLNAVSSRPHH